MTLQEFLTWIKGLIEASAPALAVILWNYDQSKINEANNKTLDAQVSLEIEKNHESVIASNANKSDLDIVNDAIVSGSGQSCSSDKENRQPDSGTKLGQNTTKPSS